MTEDEETQEKSHKISRAAMAKRRTKTAIKHYFLLFKIKGQSLISQKCPPDEYKGRWIVIFPILVFFDCNCCLLLPSWWCAWCTLKEMRKQRVVEKISNEALYSKKIALDLKCFSNLILYLAKNIGTVLSAVLRELGPVEFWQTLLKRPGSDICLKP